MFSAQIVKPADLSSWLWASIKKKDKVISIFLNENHRRRLLLETNETAELARTLRFLRAAVGEVVERRTSGDPESFDRHVAKKIK